MDQSSTSLNRTLSVGAPEGSRLDRSRTQPKTLAGKISNWILPTTRRERQRRMVQYKDVGLFVLFTTLVIVFEAKITKLITVDEESLKKAMQLPPGGPSPY
eukprot:TRINITY_DN5708_c0_g1_i2.p1 TRINITY_DN5708_c0_g1~~TRINITY_DN5708_c0_g1_i2.p1  ORF type:complete len:101 (+),score=27.98 TRINITY_DN5708_c0_g1_i2:105-407(+)